MACPNCQNPNTITYLYSSSDCPDCCTNTCYNTATPVDSSKVLYSAFPLTCSAIATGSTVELVLQLLDAKICSVSGADYSGYTIASCIVNPDSSPITNAQEFAESVSDYVCNFKSEYNTFITNYNTYVTNVTNQLNSVSTANITNTCTGIVPTDTLPQAFTKIGNSVCSLQTDTNPSTANWNDCGFSVGTAPTTTIGGFNKILDYICQVKNLIPTAVTLPVFNNIGSCLGGTLTATDSLFATVDKIKTKLCVNVNPALNYGCVNGATTLRDALQNTIDRVNQYNIYQFDPAYFTVADINALYPCNGQTVTINTAGIDSKVASNNADVTPGTLFDKLSAGANTTLDYATTPGKVIIASTAISDHKVLVNGSDATADYLDTKIDGASDVSGAITISATTNGGNSKVIVTPTIDYDVLSTAVLNQILSNSTLSTMMKNITCGFNCNEYNGVQFSIYNGSAQKYTFSASQNSPTLAWYNTGSVSTGAGYTLNSGVFTVTSVASNPQISIFYENDSLVSQTVNFQVKDLMGNPVPGSSNITSIPLAPGSIHSDGTFNLGLGHGNYVVSVTIV